MRGKFLLRGSGKIYSGNFGRNIAHNEHAINDRSKIDDWGTKNSASPRKSALSEVSMGPREVGRVLYQSGPRLPYRRRPGQPLVTPAIRRASRFHQRRPRARGKGELTIVWPTTLGGAPKTAEGCRAAPLASIWR